VRVCVYSIRAFIVLSAVLIMTTALSLAQPINSWTKPTSGNWEEPFWSLGRLPMAGDRVMLNNPGWKAVAIRSSTAQNFPASLQMQDLTVASPVDTFNTLMLDFVGFSVPVQVMGRFTVESNAAAEAFSSVLLVTNTGEFIVNGTMRQAYGGDVRTRVMHLGYQAWDASYNFSNGVLNVGQQLIVDSRSIFNQEGGSSTISNILMRNQGRFRLAGGELVGDQAFIGNGSSAVATQSGGHARWTNAFQGLLIGPNFGVGSYTLSGGTLTAAGMLIGLSGLGEFTQTGGTNNPTTLLANSSTATARYALSNGLLRAVSSMIGGNGTFIQDGGSHTADSLSVRGEEARDHADFARYELHDGVISTTNLSMRTAIFVQTGGSNFVAGNLALSSARDFYRYTMSGGMLSTSNTLVGTRASFQQSGGVHQIARTLDLAGEILLTVPTLYSLSGGELRVEDVNVSRGTFQHTGGMLRQTGVFTLTGGRFEPALGLQQLGSLRLGSSTGVSNSIFFGASATTILHFSESAGVSWDPNASLAIEGWHGIPTGGSDQLFFGNGAGGLTPQQLSQIVFVNPEGLQTGNYSARILTSGEVVPDGPKGVQFRKEGNQWVLRWDQGWTLQRAPEVTGPFEDVTNATSPFVMQPTQQREFFRLRR
jgi:hypothetical protein